MIDPAAGTQNPALADPKVRAAYLEELESEEDNIGRPGSVDEVARVVVSRFCFPVSVAVIRFCSRGNNHTMYVIHAVLVLV